MNRPARFRAFIRRNPPLKQPQMIDWQSVVQSPHFLLPKTQILRTSVRRRINCAPCSIPKTGATEEFPACSFPKPLRFGHKKLNFGGCFFYWI
ncbi:MAG: hypothetical protein D6714_06520 [Bacteroidetes bacterium]|nr:MAG: hypothetical protein D6714_06520 [Bacteroidota bacterium]